MANEYYAAPDEKTPLTTIRSSVRNNDAAAVETGFDKLPSELNVKRSQYGADVSTSAALYEVTIPNLNVAYYEGLEVTFQAVFENTGTANIQVNGGASVKIVDSAGGDIPAGSIKVDQVVTVIYIVSPTASYQIISTSGTDAAAAAAAASAVASAVSAAAALVSEDNAATSAAEAEAAAGSLDLINDITQEYEFDTETLMKASLLVFPLKKPLTTKGKATVNDGQGAKYLVQAAATVDGWRDVLLADGQSAIWQSGIGLLTSLNEYESFKPDDRRFAGAYGLTNIGAVIVVGDSNGAGTGATTYKESYMFQFLRSLWNSLDNGSDKDVGFRYETNLNMAQEFARGDIGGAASIGGNYVNGIGATNDALKIPVGTTLTLTNREISSCDFFYSADDTTAASVDFDLNGVVYANKVLSGVGIQSTFATNIFDGTRLINDTDTIGMTAVGGDIIVTGLITFRKSSTSPTMFISAQPAWGYTDFLTKATILAEHVETFATGKVKLVILDPGTNNIFAGIPKSPDDYLIAVQDLITAYNANMGNCKYLISIPAKGGPAFPTTLGSYDEYVNKIIGFCNDNNHQVMRFDRTVLSDYPADYTIDDIHYNDEGHAIKAKFLCEEVSVPYNRYNPKRNNDSAPLPTNADVTYNDTWGFFSSISFTVKAQVEGNILSLSGIAQPNASVSTTVATTPVGFRPVRAAFLTVTTSVGTTTLTWNTSGTLVVGAVAPWISFENINLVLVR